MASILALMEPYDSMAAAAAAEVILAEAEAGLVAVVKAS
jgi:hypothetical protein